MNTQVDSKAVTKSAERTAWQAPTFARVGSFGEILAGSSGLNTEGSTGMMN